MTDVFGRALDEGRKNEVFVCMFLKCVLAHERSLWTLGSRGRTLTHTLRPVDPLEAFRAASLSINSVSCWDKSTLISSRTYEHICQTETSLIMRAKGKSYWERGKTCKQLTSDSSARLEAETKTITQKHPETLFQYATFWLCSYMWEYVAYAQAYTDRYNLMYITLRSTIKYRVIWLFAR